RLARANALFIVSAYVFGNRAFVEPCDFLRQGRLDQVLRFLGEMAANQPQEFGWRDEVQRLEPLSCSGFFEMIGQPFCKQLGFVLLRLDLLSRGMTLVLLSLAVVAPARVRFQVAVVRPAFRMDE